MESLEFKRPPVEVDEEAHVHGADVALGLGGAVETEQEDGEVKQQGPHALLGFDGAGGMDGLSSDFVRFLEFEKGSVFSVHQAISEFIERRVVQQSTRNEGDAELHAKAAGDGGAIEDDGLVVFDDAGGGTGAAPDAASKQHWVLRRGGGGGSAGDSVGARAVYSVLVQTVQIMKGSGILVPSGEDEDRVTLQLHGPTKPDVGSVSAGQQALASLDGGGGGEEVQRLRPPPSGEREGGRRGGKLGGRKGKGKGRIAPVLQQPAGRQRRVGRQRLRGNSAHSDHSTPMILPEAADRPEAAVSAAAATAAAGGSSEYPGHVGGPFSAYPFPSMLQSVHPHGAVQGAVDPQGFQLLQLQGVAAAAQAAHQPTHVAPPPPLSFQQHMFLASLQHADQQQLVEQRQMGAADAAGGHAAGTAPAGSTEDSVRAPSHISEKQQSSSTLSPASDESDAALDEVALGKFVGKGEGPKDGLEESIVKRDRASRNISLLCDNLACELRKGPQTRDDLAAATGFARQRVCTVLSVYKAIGLIKECSTHRALVEWNEEQARMLPKMGQYVRRILEMRYAIMRLRQKEEDVFSKLVEECRRLYPESCNFTLKSSAGEGKSVHAGRLLPPPEQATAGFYHRGLVPQVVPPGPQGPPQSPGMVLPSPPGASFASSSSPATSLPAVPQHFASAGLPIGPVAGRTTAAAQGAFDRLMVQPVVVQTPARHMQASVLGTPYLLATPRPSQHLLGPAEPAVQLVQPLPGALGVHGQNAPARSPSVSETVQQLETDGGVIASECAAEVDEHGAAAAAAHGLMPSSSSLHLNFAYGSR